MNVYFLNVVKADDKPTALLDACCGARTSSVRVCDLRRLSRLPQSPLCYWITDAVIDVFATNGPVQLDNRRVGKGPDTGDDFRHLRLWWGLDARALANRDWVSHPKGGVFSRYYSDPSLVIAWRADGELIRLCGNMRNPTFMGLAGLTWSRRTTRDLSVRAMPRRCVFGDKGPALVLLDRHDPENELLCALAVMNSAPFASLVELRLAAVDAAARSYEVGIIGTTPIPREFADSPELGALARRAWSLKWSMDTRVEVSHAFVVPALLQIAEGSLDARADAWSARAAVVEAELARIQAEIDERCFDLYGISEEDRQSITNGVGSPSGTNGQSEPESDDEEDGDEEEGASEASANVELLTAELVSWAFGVAMGRFDVRLAVRGRSAPAEPNPFAPLPVCSQGMLTGEDGLPMAKPPADYPAVVSENGVLVDDPGHPRDIVAALRHVFDAVFAEQSDANWREAGEILDPSGNNLRRWLGSGFFEHHIKRYSKSRRKAPIYWQLGVSSGRYSVWLYAHRVTKDRLFQVLKDILQPKLNQEEGVLGRLKQEASGSPTQSQRKAIESQEDFIAELKTMIDDVARVAPMWAPDLDDGVVICLASMWRLFPQHKSWQKECKRVWDKLVEGDYDWAHMAMHLWPERVVPKCVTDRSLAIAHGLEEIFWEQDEDEKWVKRKPPEESGKAGWQPTIDRLVAERTSRQVKDALANLLAAPTAEGGGKRGRRSQAATESAANGEAARARTKRKGKTAKARDESEELF
jgi:hypothetical protein